LSLLMSLSILKFRAQLFVVVNVDAKSSSHVQLPMM
jgi:hypothetical protein